MRITLTAILAGALLAPLASAQRVELKLDQLKAKAKEATEVDLDGSALDLALKSDAAKKLAQGNPSAQKAKDLLGQVKGVYVRNYEFDGPGKYTQADVESVLKQVSGNPAWSRLVSVTEKDERVEIHGMIKGDAMQGMVILVAEPQELTVVNIVGSVGVDQAKELVNSAIHYDLSKLMPQAARDPATK